MLKMCSFLSTYIMFFIKCCRKSENFISKTTVQNNMYNVLLTAACGTLFIYISTDYVFDGRNPPYGEDDSPNPLNVYGRSKLEGERETFRHCSGTCLSLFFVFFSGWFSRCLSPESSLCVGDRGMEREPVPQFLLHLYLRCGGTAGACAVWGGGVSDGKRSDITVAEGGVSGKLHPGPLPAEISNRCPRCRHCLQEASRES